MFKKLIFGIYLVLVIGSVVAYWSKRGEPNIRQPIQFNHLIHKDVADCETCHQYVKELSFAGLPTREDCGTCHEELLTDRLEEKKLLNYIEKGQDIPWVRIYQQPPHVYFSHKRHVTLADVECQICHGKIEEQEAPPVKALVNLTMDDCLACHQRSGIKKDCIMCHR